ncbi:MAG: hypothetical protein ACT4PS_14230 [Betaproteobacteria bacterium]
MGEKLLICVSAEEVTAAHWRARRIADCRVFRNDDAGFAEFEEFLTEFAGVPAYIMVDAVEEDYRFETLPHAFGTDRGEMVRRKLRQHYRNIPHVNACFLGRDTGRRRDDRYLFSALTNPELIGGWLQAVVAKGLPVAGIFLLPMVSPALVSALRVRAGNLLLVSLHGSGLRLTFLRDRQFRLSRLTRGEAARSAGPARFIAEEISNTRIYLHALRAARLDEHLTVVLLDRNDQLAEAAQVLARDNPSLACVHMRRAEIASRLNIAESLLDLTADVVYMQLLGRQTPPGNLAPANVTGGFGRYQQRRALYAAAGFAALFAAAWSGINLWQAALVRSDGQKAAQQTTQLRASYQEVTRQFPAAPTSAANLKRAVEISQRLSEGVRVPQGYMHAVSRALDATPGIAIRQLAWRYGRTDIEAGISKPAAAAPPSAASPAPSRRETGLIDGEVKPFRGDYRAAIGLIHAFADRLAQDPAVQEARIVKLPLNIDPRLPLSGNTVDKGEHGEGAADFKVLLVMKSRS